MANKQLNSWQNVKDFLKTNIDSSRNWDAEDIKDYSVLNGKNLSYDKRAEGKTVLQQYLADADADRTFKQATAMANNEARKQTALQDFIHTRLGSYQPILQGSVGQSGYSGLTSGQAIALRNAQAQAQQTIANNKQSAQSTALSNYLQALRDNSATAIDQQTSIDATRRAEQKEKDTELKKFYDDYINGDELNDGVMTNGTIPEEKMTELEKYLRNAGASDDVINEMNFLYKDKIDRKKTETTLMQKKQEARKSQKIETSIGRTTLSKDEIQVKLPSDSPIGNRTYIPIEYKKTKIGIANDLPNGQIFLYNGDPYIHINGEECNKIKNSSFRNTDYVEKLRVYFSGTYYDFKE